MRTSSPRVADRPSYAGLLRQSPFGFLVVTAVVVLAALTPSVTSLAYDSADLQRFGAVTGAAVLYVAIARHAERFRVGIAGGPWQDFLAVWTFCAALVLPPWLLACSVAIVYVAYGRIRGGPLFRRVYSTASVILAGEAAGHVVHAAGGSVLGWSLAAVAYFVAQPLIVVVGQVSCGDRQATRRMAQSRAAWMINAATLAGGAVTAVACEVNPWWPVATVPLVIAAQWCATRLQLAETAAIDLVTGALTEAAWRRVAEREDFTAGRVSVVVALPVASLSAAELMASVGIVRGMLLGEQEVLGRYGEGLAALVRVSPVAAHNVAGRMQAAVGELALPVRVSAGAGPTLHDQLCGALENLTPA